MTPRTTATASATASATTSLFPCAQGLSAIVHATCRDMAAKVVSHRIASGAQALDLGTQPHDLYTRAAVVDDGVVNLELFVRCSSPVPPSALTDGAHRVTAHDGPPVPHRFLTSALGRRRQQRRGSRSACSRARASADRQPCATAAAISTHRRRCCTNGSPTGNLFRPAPNGTMFRHCSRLASHIRGAGATVVAGLPVVDGHCHARPTSPAWRPRPAVVLVVGFGVVRVRLTVHVRLAATEWLTAHDGPPARRRMHDCIAQPRCLGNKQRRGAPPRPTHRQRHAAV